MTINTAIIGLGIMGTHYVNTYEAAANNLNQIIYGIQILLLVKMLLNKIVNVLL